MAVMGKIHEPPFWLIVSVVLFSIICCLIALLMGSLQGGFMMPLRHAYKSVSSPCR